MAMRSGNLVVAAALAFFAMDALAEFTCKAQQNGWTAPACRSQEVRRLADQVGAASRSLRCEKQQLLELKAIQNAWGREQYACRRNDDSATCTQTSLRAELRYLQETRRCDVNARAIKFASPDAGYVALHPNTYRDAQASVMGQMSVDDCNPGSRSRAGSLRDSGLEHALTVAFSSLPDEKRDFLCNKQPFSDWNGVIKLSEDGKPYLYLTNVLGVELPRSDLQ
ncbi:MAG: hypothetical protein JO006_09350 [Paucibacter sp.]|nr:hypothetical protein [Roseateles sp.]